MIRPLMRDYEVMVLVKLKVRAVDEHNARSAGYKAVDAVVREYTFEIVDESSRYVESVQVEDTELWRA